MEEKRKLGGERLGSDSPKPYSNGPPPELVARSLVKSFTAVLTQFRPSAPAVTLASLSRDRETVGSHRPSRVKKAYPWVKLGSVLEVNEGRKPFLSVRMWEKKGKKRASAETLSRRVVKFQNQRR